MKNQIIEVQQITLDSKLNCDLRHKVIIMGNAESAEPLIQSACGYGKRMSYYQYKINSMSVNCDFNFFISQKKELGTGGPFRGAPLVIIAFSLIAKEDLDLAVNFLEYAGDLQKYDKSFDLILVGINSDQSESQDGDRMMATLKAKELARKYMIPYYEHFLLRGVTTLDEKVVGKNDFLHDWAKKEALKFIYNQHPFVKSSALRKMDDILQDLVHSILEQKNKLDEQIKVFLDEPVSLWDKFKKLINGGDSLDICMDKFVRAMHEISKNFNFYMLKSLLFEYKISFPSSMKVETNDIELFFSVKAIYEQLIVEFSSYKRKLYCAGKLPPREVLLMIKEQELFWTQEFKLSLDMIFDPNVSLSRKNAARRYLLDAKGMLGFVYQKEIRDQLSPRSELVKLMESAQIINHYSSYWDVKSDVKIRPLPLIEQLKQKIGSDFCSPLHSVDDKPGQIKWIDNLIAWQENLDDYEPVELFVSMITHLNNGKFKTSSNMNFLIMLTLQHVMRNIASVNGRAYEANISKIIGGYLGFFVDPAAKNQLKKCNSSLSFSKAVEPPGSGGFYR